MTGPAFARPAYGRVRPRCACGGPAQVVHRSRGWYYRRVCRECWSKQHKKIGPTKAKLAAIKKAQEARRDWAGDPCSRCGKYPLSYDNKKGICSDCQRHPCKIGKESLSGLRRAV